MGAGVLVQINKVSGLLDGLESGFFGRLRRADVGDDGAVVVAVGGAVEHGHTGCRDGGQDGLHHLGAAGFGKVGDTFDELIGHGE